MLSSPMSRLTLCGTSVTLGPTPWPSICNVASTMVTLWGTLTSVLLKSNPSWWSSTLLDPSEKVVTSISRLLAPDSSSEGAPMLCNGHPQLNSSRTTSVGHRNEKARGAQGRTVMTVLLPEGVRASLPVRSASATSVQAALPLG